MSVALRHRPLEPGVMFWASDYPEATLANLMAKQVRVGQLGVAGNYALAGAAQVWQKLLRDSGFEVVTVFAAYEGEDYADIPTVERTVGFIPPATRVEREARTLALSDFAAAIGVRGIACHVGFVPEDHSNPNYIAVREMVRRICDHAARYGQTFALETGQEPAHTLLAFLKDVNRPNLGINFDPANMILYGTGDPIEALGVLAPYVISVHCKDGDWPPKDVAGALGTEKPLGSGSVGMPRYVATLKEKGFRGSLNIEREGTTPEQWNADVDAALGLLRSLV
jgi:sugar phosphate isomerase/epimerase